MSTRLLGLLAWLLCLGASLGHAQTPRGALVQLNPAHHFAYGLVAWYPTLPNQIGDQHWHDPIHGLRGTLLNGAAWRGDPSGRFAGSVAMLGGSDHVLFPLNPRLEFSTGPFTACLTVQVEPGLTVDTEYSLLTKTADFFSTPGWFFGFHTFGGSSTLYALYFYNTASADYLDHSIQTSPILSTSRAYGVCATREGTTATIRVDGVIQATGTNVAWAEDVNNAIPLTLGHAPSYIGGTQPGTLLRVTNLMFWNRALSASECHAYATLRAPRYSGLVPPPPLVLMQTTPRIKRRVTIE